MLPVTHKPMIDLFEHQRSVRSLCSEIGVELPEYERTFSSVPGEIVGHVMTDAAANELAKACGLPDAEVLKKPCVRCGTPTHSEWIYTGEIEKHKGDRAPMCAKCLNEVAVKPGEHTSCEGCVSNHRLSHPATCCSCLHFCNWTAPEPEVDLSSGIAEIDSRLRMICPEPDCDGRLRLLPNPDGLTVECSRCGLEYADMEALSRAQSEKWKK